MSLLPLFVFFIIALSIALLWVNLSKILGAKSRSPRRNIPLESGMEAVGSATRRYDIKFYSASVIFILVLIEVIFLLPWVLHFSEIINKELLIIEFLIFIFVIIIGYAFLLISKGLDWKK